MRNIKNILSIVTLCIFFFFTSNAYSAVTKGNYLQVNVVAMQSTQKIPLSKEVTAEIGENLKIKDTLKSSGVGYGLSYKYAFSMKEYLVEPLDRIFISWFVL